MYVASTPNRIVVNDRQDRNPDSWSASILLSLDPPAVKVTFPDGGEESALASGPIVMGRSPSCDLHVRDPWVSRRQCVLKLFGDRLIVRDLESKNGTCVNDRIVMQRELCDGDILRVGLTSFKIVRHA